MGSYSQTAPLVSYGVQSVKENSVRRNDNKIATDGGFQSRSLITILSSGCQILAGPRGIEPRHKAFQTFVLTSLHQRPIFGTQGQTRTDIRSLVRRSVNLSLHLGIEFGGTGGSRTHNLRIKSPLRCQLRHDPIVWQGCLESNQSREGQILKCYHYTTPQLNLDPPQGFEPRSQRS